MSKRLNPNLAKIHRNYTVEEVALLFGVHKNTVRIWIKKGLPINDDKRPVLILGCELRDFIHAKRTKNKQKCKPFELYCLRCKLPQHPAGNMVEYEAISSSKGRLIAICPGCGGIINKYTSLAKLTQIQDKLDITMPKTLERINKSDELLLNSDFKQ